MQNVIHKAEEGKEKKKKKNLPKNFIILNLSKVPHGQGGDQHNTIHYTVGPRTKPTSKQKVEIFVDN